MSNYSMVVPANYGQAEIRRLPESLSGPTNKMKNKSVGFLKEGFRDGVKGWSFVTKNDYVTFKKYPTLRYLNRQEKAESISYYIAENVSSYIHNNDLLFTCGSN